MPPASARGDGAVHATTVRTPAGRSASSMALGSRPWSMPINDHGVVGEGELGPRAWRQRLGAGHVVGPVEHDDRRPPHDLHPPRHPHRAQGVLDHLGRERGTEEGLSGGHRAGGVVTLVGTVERQEHLGVVGPGGAQVEEPGRPPPPGSSTQSNSTPRTQVSAAPRLPGPAPERRSSSSGSVSPTTTGIPA